MVNADKSESEERPDVPDTTSSTDKPGAASGSGNHAHLAKRSTNFHMIDCKLLVLAFMKLPIWDLFWELLFWLLQFSIITQEALK